MATMREIVDKHFNDNWVRALSRRASRDESLARHTPMMNAFTKTQTVRNYFMAPSIS